MHALVRANWKCLCAARRGGVVAPPYGWSVLRAAGDPHTHTRSNALHPQLHPQHPQMRCGYYGWLFQHPQRGWPGFAHPQLHPQHPRASWRSEAFCGEAARGAVSADE